MMGANIAAKPHTGRGIVRVIRQVSRRHMFRNHKTLRIWSRSTHTAYRAGRAIEAGRVWTNCYHIYPAHAAFGGYKKSGVGRENHKMMLDHYQQTKNLLVSYSTKAMGFF